MSGWTLGLLPSDTCSTVPEVSSFPVVVAEGFPEVVAVVISSITVCMLILTISSLCNVFIGVVMRMLS